MKLYQIHRVQRLPVRIEEAWDFFSSPANLRTITPEWLDFSMLVEVPERMRAGTIIVYRIRPAFGIPVRWITEITHLEKPHYFIDVQRFGPYRFWHHQHSFRTIEGGVEMEDLVHYALPLGVFGRALHSLLVRRRLEEIFTYRAGVLQKHFGH